MKNSLFYALFLGASLSLFAQINENNHEKFLVVDPKGHSALINEIMYSSLTNELISVSDDKSIRLWDLEEQVLNRTFKIKSKANGPDGMIYAAALSANGRYLAVAGYSFYNDIKIIDLQQGEIVVVLTGHKNVITALDFSPDGKYLASSSADESIIIWGKGQNYLFEFKYSLYQHQKRVNDLQFSPDSKWLVSVSDDETTRVWNTKTFGDGSDPQIFRNHLGAIKKVACGNLGFITGGEKGIVNFWGWNGELKQQIIQYQGPVTAIEISDFGDYAFISGDNQIVLNLANPSRVIQLFNTNQNVSSAYFTEDNQLALAQGRSGNIVMMDLVKREPVFAFRGQGKDFNSLVINRNQIGLMEKVNADPVGFFDFDKEQIIRDQSKMKGFKGPKVANEYFEFQKVGETQLNFGASFTVNNTSRDGRILSYCILPDEQIIIGSDRTLKVYSPTGELIKELEGHNGQVLSIVSNNNFIYTYGGDQIIKVWTMDDYSLAYNLFITRGYEWILWNNEGNYTASAGGEQYLSWQVNKGENLLSDFFDVSTYGKTFMKESVAEVKVDSKRDAVEEVEIVLPEKPEIRWSEPMEYQTETSENRVRVKATIYSDQPILKTRILVSGQALPSKRGITDVHEIDEFIDLRSYKTTVEIFATTADAKIVSEKRVFINSSLKDSQNSGVYIVNPDLQPNLFFVGIGVSDFMNPEFNLTYADDDANAVRDIFASGKSKVYAKVETKIILNNEATKTNILATFADLAAKVQPKDMVILFIASHGINDKGFYYVLTHDADKKDLTGTCLNWSEIADLLGSLPCKVLLFLDTCHSGALGSNLASNEKYLKNTEALREVGSIEVGVVIMSGSTGEESSLESQEWEHGVFTLSLIKGLQDMQADIKTDGFIYLRELDFFISNNVYELTNGRQNPTTQKPSTVSKFLIY